MLGNFCPNLGEKEFSWNKGLWEFLNIPIIYHDAKNLKKLTTHSWQKCRTADGQTNRQTENRDFVALYRTEVEKLK